MIFFMANESFFNIISYRTKQAKRLSLYEIII